jgi:hypothetical protein
MIIPAERELEADDNGTGREENDSGLCSTSDVVGAHNDASEGRINSTLKFDNYVQLASVTDRKQSKHSIGYDEIPTDAKADCDSTEINATDVSEDVIAVPLERPLTVNDDDCNTVNIDDSGCEKENLDDGEAADRSSAPFRRNSKCQVTDARCQKDGATSTDPAGASSLNGVECASNNCRHQLASARRGSSAAERVPSSRVSAQNANGLSAARTPSARAPKVGRPRQKSASDAVTSQSADDSSSEHHQPTGVHPTTTPLAANSPEHEPVAKSLGAPVSQTPVQASTGSRKSISNGVRAPAGTSTASTKPVPSHALVRRKSNRFFDARVFAAINNKSSGGNGDGETKTFDAKDTWKLAHNRTSNNFKAGQQQKRFTGRPPSRATNNRRDTRDNLQSANKRVQPATASAAESDGTGQQEITAFAGQRKQSQEQQRPETRSTNRSDDDKTVTNDDGAENETKRRESMTMRLTHFILYK